MKNNSPIDLKNQLLSVISQMQSVSHLFVETGKDFSRKRRNFFLRYHSVSLIYGPDMASVPAFCQQRQKLLPETMDFLFHSFNDSFSSLETYRGFRLLACDKSDLAIAYTPDDKDTYRRHNSLERHEKGYNQLHLNALYGGLNDLFEN